jgi:hypothetical protein
MVTENRRFTIRNAEIIVVIEASSPRRPPGPSTLLLTSANPG